VLRDSVLDLYYGDEKVVEVARKIARVKFVHVFT